MYQDESTNVSIVSVSRRAALPHVGQVVFTKLSTFASGLPPSGLNAASRGNTTGSCSYGTGTAPWVSQYTMGIGVPQ